MQARQREDPRSEAGEVLIDRKQTIGLELAEYAPEFLLNSIDGVKKCAAIDFHLPAA